MTEDKAKKRRLLTFRYLDNNAVDNYLSQLEGAQVQGPYTQKEASASGGGGSARIGTPLVGIGGHGTVNSSRETEMTLQESPIAKFTRLRTWLEGEELIQSISGFDQGIYDQLEVGELVEVRGRARLTKFERAMDALNSTGILAVIGAMQALGRDPFDDDTQRLGFEGATRLAAQQRDTVIILAPMNAPGFSVVAKLAPSHLQGRKEELEGDVTIFGKIQRVLASGETIDAFRLIPQLDELIETNQPKPNRTQRRSASKTNAKQPNPPNAYEEVIKYPTLQLQPIAVYL